ncbi:MAG: hypothetical protein ABI555_10280 [Chloroflexota bacterium]
MRTAVDRRRSYARHVATGQVAELVEHLRDPLFRNAYTLIFSTGLTSVLGLVYWVLVARLYSPGEVGANAAVISSLTFLAGLSMLNLRPLLSRFLPIAGQRTVRLAIGAYATCLIVAAIAAIVYLAGSQYWASNGPITALRNNLGLTLLFVSGTMAWTIFQLQDGLLIGLRATGTLTIENLLFGVAKIGLVVVFAALALVPGYAITVSWLLPMVAAVGLVNLVMFRWLFPRHMRERPFTDPIVRVATIVRLAAADYLGSLFALSYVALLPVLVINEVGAIAGGRFYIVWVISSTLQLVAPQMISSLTVETASDPSTFHVQGRRMLIGMLRVLVPIGAVVVIAAPIILSVFGSTYEGDVRLLRLLVLAILPYSVNTLFIALLRVTVRPRRIVVLQASLAGLILGLTVVLIRPFALEGVGIGFLAGQSIVAAVVLATSLRPLVMRSPITSRKLEP